MEEYIQRLAVGSSAAFQCRECGATFPRRWSILMHVRVHTKVGELSTLGFCSFFWWVEIRVTFYHIVRYRTVLQKLQQHAKIVAELSILLEGFWELIHLILSSVVDPDPDPPDPHVFGPPGSGSTSQRYGSGSGSGSGSFYHHAKIVRKTLIHNIL